MQQKILNITVSRDIHSRQNGEIGVLTCIWADEQLPDGRVIPFRHYGAYDIKSEAELPAELRKLRHLKQRFQASVSEGRAA